MAIGRMGDMGKLATSAWLHLRDTGGFASARRPGRRDRRIPSAAADVVVHFGSRVHRIGTKLATMCVSALSRPAPGLAPGGRASTATTWSSSTPTSGA